VLPSLTSGTSAEHLVEGGLLGGLVLRVRVEAFARGLDEELHPDAEEPLLAWYREVLKEDWDTPAKVKAKYRTASIVAGNRVVFNIEGNDTGSW
jgi:hypothetical protein